MAIYNDSYDGFLAALKAQAPAPAPTPSPGQDAVNSFRQRIGIQPRETPTPVPKPPLVPGYREGTSDVSGNAGVDLGQQVAPQPVILPPAQTGPWTLPHMARTEPAGPDMPSYMVPQVGPTPNQIPLADRAGPAVGMSGPMMDGSVVPAAAPAAVAALPDIANSRPMVNGHPSTHSLDQAVADNPHLTPRMIMALSQSMAPVMGPNDRVTNELFHATIAGHTQAESLAQQVYNDAIKAAGSNQARIKNAQAALDKARLTNAKTLFQGLQQIHNSQLGVFGGLSGLTGVVPQ